ncbi:MAG TPA: glutaredoxin family protein [Pyrinomonadaceae bacterium]|nr:glutaredoxin family protein [Pyrinomonadaceae bacterium]HLE63367.1 glutaredoxin family protein [Pyrinomonadaceae bacterium]
MKPHVIIYSRPGCHLCDVAKETIDDAGGGADYTLETVNIENDAGLLKKYKYDIPVITINGVETFKHRVNSNLFKAAIAKATKASHEPLC